MFMPNSKSHKVYDETFTQVSLKTNVQLVFGDKTTILLIKFSKLNLII